VNVAGHTKQIEQLCETFDDSCCRYIPAREREWKSTKFVDNDKQIWMFSFYRAFKINSDSLPRASCLDKRSFLGSVESVFQFSTDFVRRTSSKLKGKFFALLDDLSV